MPQSMEFGIDRNLQSNELSNNLSAEHERVHIIDISGEVDRVSSVAESVRTHNLEVRNDGSEPCLSLKNDVEEVPSCFKTHNESKFQTVLCSVTRYNLGKQQEEWDEGQCCPICLEPWSNAGKHRLVSLRCGHLFGQSCIIRWLRGEGQKCPQCNMRARKKDIRIIYAKSIVVIDTAERDRALHSLDKERTIRRQIELDFMCVRLQLQLCQQEIVRLNQKLQDLKDTAHQDTSVTSGQNPPQKDVHLQFYKHLDINKNGECRVMAYSSALTLLVISQPNCNLLFPGFGIKKVDMMDIRVTELLPLHQKQIRDLAFNPIVSEMLLSVSFDCIAKLVNVVTNNIMKTYSCPSPIWSCCWNQNDPNVFFVGLQTGIVRSYDIREDERYEEISCMPSPVISICSVQKNFNSSFPLSGLLIARLNSCFFCERRNDSFFEVPLVLDGLFTALSFDRNSHHLLLACRPSSKHPLARYLLGELRVVSEDDSNFSHFCVWNELHTFSVPTSMKVLSRPCLFPDPKHQSRLVCVAGIEHSQNPEVRLWDSSGNCIQTLTMPDPVLDVHVVQVNCETLVAMLTEKQLYVYRWV